MRRQVKAPIAGSNSGTGGRGRLLVLLLGIAACASLLFGAANASAYLSVDHEFGSVGAGNGQFNAARGVATSESTGDVYVVDSGNNRVQRFDSDGNYLSQFGAPGSGPGQFSRPQAAAIDQSDGSIYVVDMGNNRIEKFDASGALIDEFGTPGAANGQLSEPRGIAVDPTNGDVLVADSGNNRVQRFDSDGNYLSQFAEGAVFSAPSQLATDSTGDVYVLEKLSQVRKFDSSGALIETVAANLPFDVAVNQANDHLFVVEGDLNEHFHITEHVASGALLESYEAFLQPESFDNGFAFNSTEGAAYYTNGGKRVVIWEESTGVVAETVAATYTEAKLGAKISPEGLQTTYHFEYGLTSAYGNSTPSKTVPAGNPSVAVSAAILGLTEGTTYHFRAVSTNANGEKQGIDKIFTTLVRPSGASESCPNAAIRSEQGARVLGDCRAFELVSPQDKAGADLYFGAGLSSLDGNAISFQSSAGFSGSAGASHGNQYVARRGSDGWAIEPLTPYMTPDVTAAFVEPLGYESFTPDLSRAILFSKHDPNDLSSNVEQDQRRLYLHTAGGGYQPISPAATTIPGLFYPGPLYVGGSTDLSHLFFESDRHLTPDAPAEGTNELYEWANGEVSVVGVLPNGSVAPEGATAGSNQLLQSAISGDGSEVAFESGSPAQLYLRTDGTTTTEISLSQKAGSVGDPSATGVHLMGSASEDGETLSKIYFTSSDQLTDEALSGPGSEGADLYEYDVSTGTLKDLASFVNVGNPPAAAVEPNWLGAAKDGSYVYFKTGEGLFVEHEGVATLVASDSFSSQPRLSDDGKRALIFTAAELSQQSTGKLEQAFVYDAPSNSFDCISCPVGHPPTSYASSGFGGVGGYTHLLRLQPAHNMTRDGKRVFFETAEALDPRDANGQIDVYEWEDGQVKLVSSGRGSDGAHFLDASADGDDVFILTHERLLASDHDSNLDLYDARVDGGLPLPPIPGAACEGDACQNPPSPPNDATPASAAFKGAGNEKPRAKKAQHKKRKHARHKKRKASAKHRAHARHTTRSHG